MTKKDFIALANMIRDFSKYEDGAAFTQKQVEYLASFCELQNPQFNRERWLDYIAGKCGPNGGAR